MLDLGAAIEDDMVLSFLQSEIDSARFAQYYQRILINSGLDRNSLIDQPDRCSPQARQTRRDLLRSVRGYGNNDALFRGFPNDLAWRRIILEQSDLPKLKYANYPSWVQLSRGTRLAIDGATNLGSDTAGEEAVNICAIVADLRRGRQYPPLIGVYDKSGENILLIEGHSR